MKNARRIPAVLLLLAASAFPARAQTGATTTFDEAADGLARQLEEATTELAALREEIAAEKIPMNRRLSELEAELLDARAEYQQVTRLLDSRNLALTNLKGDLERRDDEASYLSNLLGDYIREFESRLHIAELPRYEEALEAAKLAPENTNLSEHEVFAVQAALLDTSFDRLVEALNGTRFEGAAVGPDGRVHRGTFLLVGPAALFRSDDGAHVGTVEQRLGSLEPSQMAFADPVDAQAADALVRTGTGLFPLDPTLGNAHKIEATEEETLWEEVQKGGLVMIPIFALAAAALLVALVKWVSLATLRRPSRAQVDALLAAVDRRAEGEARERAAAMKGPVGRMLAAGVEHMREPRELVEEVLYETVLTTRLRLERMLPFIAVSASSAPLLGLLGTVTGIISTFKLLNVFGSGDVRNLSGGISEALITTKYGLIVAIPSLLIHAFLSRKGRAIVSQMETAAIAFVNHVSRTAPAGAGERDTDSDPDPEGARRAAPRPSPKPVREPELNLVT